MIRLPGLLSLTLAAPAPAAARELPGFLARFEGEFDTFQQVFQEREARAAKLHGHIRINLRWIQTGLVREGSK